MIVSVNFKIVVIIVVFISSIECTFNNTSISFYRTEYLSMNDSKGEKRKFFVDVPNDFNESENQFPALIMIHGWKSCAHKCAYDTGLNVDGPANGFVTIFPNSKFEGGVSS